MVVEYKTRTQVVVEAIREKILTGAIKAGEPLRQAALADELKVSRIPVREALLQLEAEGLVEFEAHKGATATKLSAEQVTELFELRALLECELLRLAIPKLTEAELAQSEQLLQQMSTAYQAALAHAAGVSIEAELGYVGYAQGAASHGTDPDQVARFAQETGVDALAISIGNTHLMTEARAEVDMPRLTAIMAAAPTLPLVLHGGSGLPLPLRHALARDTTVAKVNIGTELRMAFGQSLRAALAADPAVFDRNAILRATIGPLEQAARDAISSLCPA